MDSESNLMITLDSRSSWRMRTRRAQRRALTSPSSPHMESSALHPLSSSSRFTHAVQADTRWDSNGFIALSPSIVWKRLISRTHARPSAQFPSSKIEANHDQCSAIGVVTGLQRSGVNSTARKFRRALAFPVRPNKLLMFLF